MHIHILGICGTFMGGLAALAREAGHTVTGCDAGVYPPMSEQLRALGIDLLEGYGADQLALKPDMFVIGNVVSRARLANGVPKFPLMEAILDAGLQPGFLVGGVPLNFGISARLGGLAAGRERPFFVIEADEYDTAFFDKRSKFVHYRPRTAVLNNLEFDHADIFGSLADIERQFHHLLRTVPATGRVIVNGQDASLARVLAQGVYSEVSRFGMAGGEAPPDFAASGEPGDFDVLHQGRPAGRVSWALPGAHNQLNALAAIAAAWHAGVPPQQACEALARFENVRRRMEVRARIPVSGGSITLYDDFAHHPTAIRATVDGLRRQLDAQGRQSERILALFEPRSNTMKLGAMKERLPWALENAALAFCHAGGLEWDAAAALAPLGARAQVAASVDELVAQATRAARAGDHLLCMSNGGFGGVHEKLAHALWKP